jgi:hypothetical protein
LNSLDTPPRSPFAQSPETLASERLRRAIERNRAKQRRREAPASSDLPSGVTNIRRGIATANNVEFTSELTSPTPKPPVPIKYVSAKRKVTARRKKPTSSALPQWLEASSPLDYFVKACWIFAFVLVGRLIFSTGGVVDFYSKKSLIAQKVHEKNLVIEENASLVVELEMIKNDQAYQRKLVREHLGFIGVDEYLILFQSERRPPSI